MQRRSVGHIRGDRPWKPYSARAKPGCKTSLIIPLILHLAGEMAQARVPATQTSRTSATDSAHVGTLRLSVKKKKLTWTEDVIDNEHAGKKKSNSAFRRGRVRERGP